jgi:hypothetical protein
MKMLTQCKIKTSLVLIFAAASVYSGLSLAQDMDGATPVTLMKYHNNTVTLKIKSPGYMLLGGSYVTKDQSISGGQDPHEKNKPPQSYDVSGGGEITFSVGRNGSERVGNWFASQVGGSHNTFGKNPDKLNFAFNGDLSLLIDGPGLSSSHPVSLPDIFLAQGHTYAANNWWFGGLACTRFATLDQVSCRSANYPTMTFVFVRGQGQYGLNPVDEVDLYIMQ